MSETATTEQVTIDVHLPASGPLAGMADDVREGLSCPFKELPPKYFYDERGSELFERIMELPEYYPTRAERAILDARAAEIVAAANPATLIELGSGSAAKTRSLLDAMRDAGTLETYVPVDISEEITRRTAETLVGEYDGLRVHGVICDYETHLERVPREEGAIIAFLGGTIGNFRPAPRRSFLARIATLMYPGDRFLLGHRPRQGPRPARGRLRRLGRGDLRVQQERAQRPQPRARRQLRPRRVRARRLLGRRQLLDRHPPALAGRAVHRPDRARYAGPLRPQRGDADRDLDQVHARAAGGGLRGRRSRDDRALDRPRRPLRPQPRAGRSRSAAPAPRSARPACRAS